MHGAYGAEMRRLMRALEEEQRRVLEIAVTRVRRSAR